MLPLAPFHRLFSNFSDRCLHTGGKDSRAYDTVKPLAENLGLNIDMRYKRDDSEGVAQAVQDFRGPGNILICGEHEAMTNIATAIGAEDAPEYPKKQ